MNSTTEVLAPTKAQLITELYAFARQRPGLDWRNYFSGWQDTAGRHAYASDVRAIGRDYGDARLLIRAIDLRDSITAADILAGLERHFAGRLSWNAETESLDYCTGQYWPTEYRKAVCAVCAGVLWAWVRGTSMPVPTYRQHGSAESLPMSTEARYDGKSAGDWLRRHFRREFGRGIAGRWFN